ncbi:MAG: DUF1028 domain-containing protein [Burkholderiales bacterium]
MTFAISARCPRTGRFGVAISTRPMAVAARCPFIAPGVGVVVTMATTDPRLGPLGLNLLRLGYSAQRVLDEIAASDPKIDWRQVSVIDRDGNAVARTGGKNNPWAGAIIKPNLVAMGNNLTSERTATAMAAAFEADPAQELEERLMCALEAGRDAGGQNGGQQSAGLLSYDREIYAYADLRVDLHAEPIGELRRLYAVYGPQAPYWYQRPARPDDFPRRAEDWVTAQRAK